MLGHVHRVRTARRLVRDRRRSDVGIGGRRANPSTRRRRRVAAASLRTSRARRAPTFTKDVAPIFQDKCEACHRPDSIAPMSLVTYAEARPWARSIKARVADHQMPPWNIDKSVGVQSFKNDRSLNDKQIDTIVKWVDAGAPQGNPKDMPAPRTWPEDQGWNFAALFGQKEPDLIVKSLRLHHAGAVAGRVGQAHHALGHHRAALGPRDRDSSRRPSRAGRSCITRSPISSRPIRARRRRAACPRRSWNGRSASRAS